MHLILSATHTASSLLGLGASGYFRFDLLLQFLLNNVNLLLNFCSCGLLDFLCLGRLMNVFIVSTSVIFDVHAEPKGWWLHPIRVRPASILDLF